MLLLSALKTWESKHLTAGAWLRFILVVAVYGSGAILGLLIVVAIIVYASRLAGVITAALNGYRAGSSLEMPIAFILTLGAQASLGISAGYAVFRFNQKWPDNVIVGLMRWIKEPPRGMDT